MHQQICYLNGAALLDLGMLGLGRGSLTLSLHVFEALSPEGESHSLLSPPRHS
jgi:hypothetical protein